MILANRHYVSISTRGLRRHLVMKTVEVRGNKPHRKSYALRYEIVGRHFTRRKAEQRARILNAQNGRAH